MLQPENGIGCKETYQTEDKQRDGILLPGLFLFRVKPKEIIKQPFGRTKHRVEKGLTLNVQNLHKIDPNGLRQHQENPDEDCQLAPTIDIHNKITSSIDEDVQNFSGRRTTTRR
jgi:hypothetical protein